MCFEVAVIRAIAIGMWFWFKVYCRHNIFRDISDVFEVTDRPVNKTFVFNFVIPCHVLVIRVIPPESSRAVVHSTLDKKINLLAVRREVV